MKRRLFLQSAGLVLTGCAVDLTERTGEAASGLDHWAFDALTSVQTVPWLLAPPVVHLISDGSNRTFWFTRRPDGTNEKRVRIPRNFDIDSQDPHRPPSYAAHDPRWWLVIEQHLSGPYADASLVPRAAASGLALPDCAGGLTTIGGGCFPTDGWKDFQDAVLKSMPDDGSATLAGIFVNFDPAVLQPHGSGASQPDGKWHQGLNDAGNGTRYPNGVRILYFNRYPGTWVEELPET